MNGVGPGWVSQSTVSVIDQSTVAVIDGRLRRVRPRHDGGGCRPPCRAEAYILPLKAFNADGSGYKSDVIRAIYHAVRSNARVLNMSFSFSTPSPELSCAMTTRTAPTSSASAPPVTTDGTSPSTRPGLRIG